MILYHKVGCLFSPVFLMKPHSGWFNKTFPLCFAVETDDRDQSKLEEKLWDPECPLTDKQIDQFLVVAR